MAEFKVADIRPLYAFLDPSGGQVGAERLRRIASNAAICVGGQDALGRYFLLDAWADRVSTDDLVERMYALTARWHIRSFGVEANGLAGLFSDALDRDARRSGRDLPVVKVYQPTHTEKDFRIRTILQPLVGNGRLFLARHLIELRDQICAFPLAMSKDLIDCAASLCRFMPPRPDYVTRNSERDQLALYLRGRGVDPATIARETGQPPTTTERPWTSFTNSLSRSR